MKEAEEILAVVREFLAMDVTLGEEGLDKTWQRPFPATTGCCWCGGESRIGFVAHEGLDGMDDVSDAVWAIRPNGGEGDFWPHDRVSFAIYICPDCFEGTVIWNQA